MGGTNKVNENVEDKARALLIAMSEQRGHDYDVILFAVGARSGDISIVAMPKDPTKEIPIYILQPLVNGIKEALENNRRRIRPDKTPIGGASETESPSSD